LVPNRTSGKIKLTLPVDSYTTILLVYTLNITQTTQGWFLQMSFLGGLAGIFGLVKDLASIWQEPLKELKLV